MARVEHILAELEKRRRAVGMPRRVLAARSGLTLRTVQRVLSGEGSDVRLRSLLAMAEALAMEARLAKRTSPEVLRRRQARAKARKLAGVAQGSAALEGMAVPDAALRAVARRIEEKLLGGPAIRLWS